MTTGSIVHASRPLRAGVFTYLPSRYMDRGLSLALERNSSHFQASGLIELRPVSLGSKWVAKSIGAAEKGLTRTKLSAKPRNEEVRIRTAKLKGEGWKISGTSSLARRN
jgi:hypothetical protein